MSGPIASVVGAVMPARLGSSFRWLLGTVAILNIGDGIVLAAGPLLTASLTRDAFLVSLAALCEYLPALLFGTIAGVVVDRVDRRRVLIAVNAARALVLGVLSIAVATGSITIWMVFASILLVGTAETFADLAATSILPRLVPRESLGLANARLQAAFQLMNQLIGPPIGAFLFVVGVALPFATNAVCYALGAVLITRIASSAMRSKRTIDPGGEDDGEVDDAAGAARSALAGVWHDMVDGFRWLRQHPPMRTLALTIVAFNVTYGAAWSVLVLYARDQLRMDSVGFGLLSTALAVGGIIGTAIYGRLERRFSLADIMRTGLLIETGTHLVLALTHSPVIALGIMVVFGAHASIWYTTSTTVQQRAVPDALMGRVAGLYRVGVFGGLVIGTPIGGVLARELGITAPFWFGFLGSAVLVTILWRELANIVHASEIRRATAPT